MTTTRGIRSFGAHIPYRRLDRAEIRAVFGSGGGTGSRAVASFDEDTTTMAVEACRSGSAARGTVDALWFATTAPAYADKSNAATVHAALDLPAAVPAIDLGASLGSGMAGLVHALGGVGDHLVVASDIRTGLPTSGDESAGGDGAAALVVGDGDDVAAEVLATASVTVELLDRWRPPGDARPRAWEERFAERVYVDAAVDAFGQALDDAGLEPPGIDLVAVTGLHARAVGRATRKLGVEATPDDLATTVGNPGCAQPLLVLATALEQAEPGQTIAAVHLADGAQVALLRATGAIADAPPRRSVHDQVAAGGTVPYGTFLAWRGQVAVEPPNRPGPNRVSASAAQRRQDWKFRFTASRDRSSGMLHLPPARVSEKGGAVDDMEPVIMADVPGTIAALTVDRLAYSPSPPVVFAVVDFDGGGRAPLELTDVDAATVAVGDRVEPTFRRLSTADGIHNYFWKVRPLRTGGSH